MNLCGSVWKEGSKSEFKTTKFVRLTILLVGDLKIRHTSLTSFTNALSVPKKRQVLFICILNWTHFVLYYTKNYPFCEVCEIWCFHKITGVTLYLSKNLQKYCQNIWVKHSSFSIFCQNFSGKIENFGNLTCEKHLTNSMSGLSSIQLLTWTFQINIFSITDIAIEKAN